MVADEKYLTLSDGRTLAYGDMGDASSSTVVIFFHGVFGVGRVSRLPPVFRERNAHFIAPTLPGWGSSSPHPSSASFVSSLLLDTTELLHHLHPNDENLQIYVAGGSYGTAPAQILYGAPFDVFPLGRHIVGCLLIAPFSPFRWHKGYTKALSWPNYISVGPPAVNIPFLPHLMAFAIKAKLKTVDAAEAFIRQTLFDRAPAEEVAAFAKWKQENGIEDGELEKQFGENAIRSISQSTAGFMEVAKVLHSDWGFRPDQLDDEHNKRPLLVVVSTGDSLASPELARWLVNTYVNAEMREVKGGHIAAIYELDGIWREMVNKVEGTPS